MKYEELEDGDWISPIMRGYRLMCCDCSLVHVVDFRIKNGELQIRLNRHPQATSAARRQTKKAKK